VTLLVLRLPPHKKQSMMLDESLVTSGCEGSFYALGVAVQECEAALHVLSQLAKGTWTAACDTLAQGQHNRISQRTVYALPARSKLA